MKKIIIISTIIIVVLAGYFGLEKFNSNKDFVENHDSPVNEKWVEISVFTQRQSEPWGDVGNIKMFFEQAGVKVYDTKIKSRMVCEALDCPSYELKEILIDKNDKNKVEKILDEHKTNLDLNNSEYTSESWENIISEECQYFFDGCNKCWREKPGDTPGCTREGCEEYQKPYCLDDCAGKGEFVNPDELKGKTKYPNFCCAGLKGLASFRIGKDGECENLLGTPYLTCMFCGNGVCETAENGFDENRCNCPEDCK